MWIELTVTPSTAISGAAPLSHTSNALFEAMYALQRIGGKSTPDRRDVDDVARSRARASTAAARAAASPARGS